MAIFHVGTNNIETMESGDILSGFNYLITSIGIKSAIMIVISSILSRPNDHTSYGDRIKLVNEGLVKLSKDR